MKSGKEFPYQGLPQKFLNADLGAGFGSSEVPQPIPLTIYYPPSRDNIALNLRSIGDRLFPLGDSRRNIAEFNTSTLSSVLSELTSRYQVAPFPERIDLQVASLDTAQGSKITATADAVDFLTGLINSLREYKPAFETKSNSDRLSIAITTLQAIASAAHTQNLEVVLSRAVNNDSNLFVINDITLLPKEEKKSESK